MISIRAIRPRNLPMARNTNELLTEQLGRLGFAGAVIDDLANTRLSSRARASARASVAGATLPGASVRSFVESYRRTGRLGKGWRSAPSWAGAAPGHGPRGRGGEPRALRSRRRSSARHPPQAADGPHGLARLAQRDGRVPAALAGAPADDRPTSSPAGPSAYPPARLAPRAL